MSDLYSKQIALEEECINHTYTQDRAGYSKLNYRDAVTGKRVSLLRHRKVYCDTHDIPYAAIQGKVVRHICDNTKCINPKHLVLGSQADNIQDRVTRGRCARGASQGLAKLTEGEVLEIRALYQYNVVGGYNTVSLGKLFGVSSKNISDIVRRITWRHI